MPVSSSRVKFQFQSTLPARGATHRNAVHCAHGRFQSTLPARGATVMFVVLLLSFQGISIHAPRTGSDTTRTARCWKPAYFNPRSPHGERPDAGLFAFTRRVISIHAPRTGSDPRAGDSRCRRCNFNPRSPHGERRKAVGNDSRGVLISIHAPRTGSDLRCRRGSPALP